MRDIAFSFVVKQQTLLIVAPKKKPSEEGYGSGRLLSPFVGEHERCYPLGDCRVSGVRRVHLHLQIVVLDDENEFAVAEVKLKLVVLPGGIYVRRPVFELRDLL